MAAKSVPVDLHDPDSFLHHNQRETAPFGHTLMNLTPITVAVRLRSHARDSRISLHAGKAS